MSVVDGSSLEWAAIVHSTKTAASKEPGEEVLGGQTTATATTTLEAGLAMLIVDLSLLGIRQDLVGVRNLLELILSTEVVGVLVCRGC